MVKRIVSGIFALAALAALGVIIGGALASGEQLIVRFLTAVIVAALALYVISDLRLKSTPQTPAEDSNDHYRPLESQAPSPSVPKVLEAAATTTDATAPRRDLQPAARTIDVVHRTTPPTPPPALAKQNIAPEPPPEEATAPLPAVAQDAQETQILDLDADVSDKAEAQESAVYVAVGTHSYEGGLETPAPDWPNKSASETVDLSSSTQPDSTQPDSTQPDSAQSSSTQSNSAQSNSVPAVEQSAPALPQEIGADATQTLAPPPLAEPPETSIPILAPLTPESIPTKPILETQPVVEPIPHSADIDDSTTSVIDLARTTASYAGPVQTPVIDLREPVTDEVPAAPAEALPPIEESINESVEVIDLAPAPPALQPSDDVPILKAATPQAAEQPLVSTPQPHSERVAAAIAGGERKVIETLLRQGMLTTDGPITDRDVRTMVYVAFTSNELRKIIVAGGRINTGDRQLGPVELFDESVFQPVPKTVYTGRPSVGQPPTPASAGLIQKPLPERKEEAPA